MVQKAAQRQHHHGDEEDHRQDQHRVDELALGDQVHEEAGDQAAFEELFDPAGRADLFLEAENSLGPA